MKTYKTYEHVEGMLPCIKKPIIVHMEQGKANAPDWLFGTIPHNMIFSCWDAVKDYLIYIDMNKDIETFNRWYFFT
jgi:hypothetical protein